MEIWTVLDTGIADESLGSLGETADDLMRAAPER